MLAEDLHKVFPQWTPQEIEDIMRNQVSDDDLFQILSDKPITDEQLAHHIKDDVCQIYKEGADKISTVNPNTSTRRMRTWRRTDSKREKLLDDVG